MSPGLTVSSVSYVLTLKSDQGTQLHQDKSCHLEPSWGEGGGARPPGAEHFCFPRFPFWLLEKPAYCLRQLFPLKNQFPLKMFDTRKLVSVDKCESISSSVWPETHHRAEEGFL